MIMGLLPFRNDVLKKPRLTEKEYLLKSGWLLTGIRVLGWQGSSWTLYYKIISEKPVIIPGHLELFNTPTQHWQYIEFKALHDADDNRVELFAYGNFLKGDDKPYLMRARQVLGPVNTDEYQIKNCKT